MSKNDFSELDEALREQAVIEKQLRYQERKQQRFEKRDREMRTPAPNRDAIEAQRRRKAGA
jgi:hypothetical protein